MRPDWSICGKMTAKRKFIKPHHMIKMLLIQKWTGFVRFAWKIEDGDWALILKSK